MDSLHEVIDLVGSDDEDINLQRALRERNVEPARKEQEQKKNIMALAASVNASRGLNPHIKRRKTIGSCSEVQDGTAGVSTAKAAEVPAPALATAAAVPAPTNDLLAKLHAERLQRQQQQAEVLGNAAAKQDSSDGSPTMATDAAQQPAAGSRQLEAKWEPPGHAFSGMSLLTYNIWFNEQVEMVARMHGLSQVVEECGHPDFICLQEVTPNLLHICRRSSWFSRYSASPCAARAGYFTLVLVKRRQGPGAGSPPSFTQQPFANSRMGRSVLGASTLLDGCKLFVATSHLESPCGREAQYTRERASQARQGVQLLDSRCEDNVIWCGDMNWVDDRDGQLCLPSGWQDAWLSTRPGQDGYTYNGRANPMLGHSYKGSRLDRIFVKLRDYSVEDVQLVGTKPLPGVAYTKATRSGVSKQLPVLVSDHFGLFMKLRRLPGRVLGKV